MQNAAREVIEYGIKYFFLYTGEMNENMTADDFVKGLQGTDKKAEKEDENEESDDDD